MFSTKRRRIYSVTMLVMLVIGALMNVLGKFIQSYAVGSENRYLWIYISYIFLFIFIAIVLPLILMIFVRNEGEERIRENRDENLAKWKHRGLLLLFILVMIYTFPVGVIVYLVWKEWQKERSRRLGSETS